jgi:hypothetical protein
VPLMIKERMELCRQKVLVAVVLPPFIIVLLFWILSKLNVVKLDHIFRKNINMYNIESM